MGATTAPDARLQYEDLTKGASLDVLILRSSKVDVKDILRSPAREALIRAALRRTLFFDELTTVTVVVSVNTTDAALQDFLPNLEVTIAAHATSSAAEDENGGASLTATGKHDLTSITIPASEFDDVFVTEDTTTLIWSPIVHLTRPRVKLQKAVVSFSASFALTSAALSTAQRGVPEVLKCYEPLPRNVLQPLRYDPALHEIDIQLSETRVTKIAPAAAPPGGDIVPLRGVSKRALPWIPALFTKIRYSSLSDAIVASLHIETASDAGVRDVLLTDVRLKSDDAIVHDLHSLALPIETCGGDETVVLKRLTRKLGSTASVAAAAEGEKSTVTVHIEASASTSEEVDIPVLVTWQSQLHLTQTLPKPVYKWSRAIVEASAVSSTNPNIAPQSTDTSAIEKIDQPNTPGSVIFNFSAPAKTSESRKVEIQVQCINHSTGIRHFSLIPLPAKPTKRVRVTSRASDLSATALAKTLETFDNAPPPPASESERAASVFDLTPSVRVGPLAPGSSFETKLRYRVLVDEGTLNFGSVRVVDLDSKRTVEVATLPDVSVDEIRDD